MRPLAYLAPILIAASGCDKTKEGQTLRPAGAAQTSRRLPDGIVLFQVFGDANDPRILPVAMLDGSRPLPIVLDSAGWRSFDSAYFRSGKSYPVYRGGRPRGYVHVRRGMWERRNQTTYDLPDCRSLTPVAAVRLDESLTTDFTVEMLSSSKVVGAERPESSLPSAITLRVARQMAPSLAATAGISQRSLDALHLAAVAVPAGVTAAPTIIAAFTDPNAEASSDDASERTAHMLLMADADSAGQYRLTYKHRINGPLSTAVFQRYLDHLDLTGDGRDEIVLEEWRFGSESYLVVLSSTGGEWRETFRSRARWCLDEGS